MADRSSLRRVVDALGERVRINRGDQVYARCPVPRHEDRNPSLSVTWKVDRGGAGRTFVHCQRDCSPTEVVDALALTLSDLYDTPPARPGNGRSTWTMPARPRKAKSPRPSSSAGHGKVRRPDPAAVYTYTDADGVRVFAVERYEVTEDWPQKFGAVSYDTAGGRIVARKAPAPARRVLYRLPEVAAAIDRGDPVYVVEGEKDADAVAAAGAVATTNPFGACDTPARAAEKWLPQYTRSLAGAHVVIVADRDPASKGYPGYRHALHVAGELADVAASVRVVQAATGKDAADHLAAGHGLDDLAPLDVDDVRAKLAELDTATASTAPAPATPPAATPARDAETVDLEHERRRRRGDGGDGAGGNGDGTGSDGEWDRVVVRDRFEATPEGLFKLKFEREANVVIAQELLPVRVRLTGRVREDVGDGSEPELTHVDLAADSDGESIELRNVERKRWESCAWVSELPWPAPYNDTAAGRATLRNAIVATSGPVPLATQYGALGWHLIAGRWVYLHAGGALDASGPVTGLRVRVPEPLQPLALPDPPADVAELRQAVQASTTALDVLPARIAAPLLGAAYRASLGYSRVTVMPVGPKASGKTGLAALAEQHYAPTARHNALPGTGAGEAAATVAGLEELRFRAGDMLLVLDDLAPDRGIERASMRAAEIARSQYNRTARARQTRDGGLRPMHKPRSLALLTGEEGTTVESADSRIVSLRVSRGDLDTDYVLPTLDEGREPEFRAMLTAAMVVHYAPAMPLTDWLDRSTRELRSALRDDDASDPGLDVRHAESVADLATGWRAMLDMATARGALTADEAAELWSRAWAGLVECKRHLMAGSASRTPADRVRELLTAVLVRRDVSIAARDGGRPDNAERWGWERLDADTMDPYRASGPTIGWTDGEHVWLYPGAVFPALERQAKAEGEPLNYSRQGLGCALADAGVIRTRMSKGIRRNTVPLRVGQDQRQVTVWEFDAAWLYPGDEDGPDEDRPVTPPPTPPAPVDRPGGDVPGRPGPAADTPARPEPSPDVPQAAESHADAPAPPSAGEAPGTGRTAASGAVSGSTAGRGRTRKAAPVRQYRGVAVVCDDPAGGWLARPGAELVRVELPAELTVASLLGWMDSLELGHADGRGKYRGAQHGYGQLWVRKAVRRRLGWPASLPESDSGKESAAARKVRASIEAAGWHLSSRGRIGPWMVVYRDGGLRHHLVVPEWLEAPTAIGEDVDDGAELARRLALYADRTGVSYLWSPAVSGIRAMTTTRPELLAGDRPALPPPALRGDLAEGDCVWTRALAPDERDRAWLDLWDFNALYLGATSSLPLAKGAYVHVEKPAVELNRPGLWRLESLPKWEHSRLPDPFASARARGRRPWVATPTLKTAEAFDLLDDLTVSEAYVAAETMRLDAWAREMRDARAGLLDVDDPAARAVRDAVKATYAGAVGRLDAQTLRQSSHPMWRPDIRAHVVSQGRFVVLRRIVQAAEAGWHPVAVAVDAVAYVSDAATPADAVPPGFTQGTGLGQVKHVGRVRLADVADLLSADSPHDLMDRVKTGAGE